MNGPVGALLYVVCAVSSISMAACGATADASRRRTEDPRASIEPRWEDAFDVTPDLTIIIFPSALRSDSLYGPLLRRAIEFARQQSPVVAETRALDAMEDADEVIAGMWPDSPAADGEVLVVARGVRGDVDPAMLVDSAGRALWMPGPSGPVRELVRNDAPGTPSMLERDAERDAPPSSGSLGSAASLFELPGRTWVIASGEARTRARAAFAHPADVRRRSGNSTRLEARGDVTLALLRIDGTALVERNRALRSSGVLGALGRKLKDVTFELPAEGPSSAGGANGRADGGSSRGASRVVRATFSYESDDAAALAAGAVRQVFEAIARKRPEQLAWISELDLSVEQPPERVVLTAPLPPRLVDTLLHARTARLTAPTPPPENPRGGDLAP